MDASSEKHKPTASRLPGSSPGADIFPPAPLSTLSALQPFSTSRRPIRQSGAAISTLFGLVASFSVRVRGVLGSVRQLLVAEAPVLHGVSQVNGGAMTLDKHVWLVRKGLGGREVAPGPRTALTAWTAPAGVVPSSTGAHGVDRTPQRPW